MISRVESISPPASNLSHAIKSGLIILLTIFTFWSVSPPVYAAVPSKNPHQDVLLLSNGDHLTGTLDRIVKGKLYFKTDATGILTVTVDKVKELRTKDSFAVIITTKSEPYIQVDTWIPIGPIDLFGPILEIHSQDGLKVFLVKKVTYVVSERAYRNSIKPSAGLFQGWKGSVMLGASNVTATQNVNTYTSGISLVRSYPSTSDPWLTTLNRTILGFSSTYGSISQPNTPAIETTILHGNAEQDRYFTNRFYALVQAVFDENSTQGLNLQQLYGTGIGYTPIKSDNQQLDLTFTGNFIRQEFTDPANNQNLVGTSFADTYSYKFPHDILLAQTGSITPVWNNMNAYFANFSVSLTVPFSKLLSFSIQAIDSYLNDPAPGFTKNSVQINSGLTYTIQ